MKSTVKKLLMMLLLLVAGGAIFVYARDKHFTGGSENEAESEMEDVGQLTGDDPWQEMDKLVQAYYKAEGVSYSGTIKLIDDNAAEEKVIEQQPFEYATIGRTTYYKMGQVEVITKSDLMLVADNANKTLSVSAQPTHVENNAKLFDIEKFKEMMATSNAEAKVTELGNQKVLTIENINDPQIQGYRIYYDPATYQVSKMLIGMLRLSPLDDEDEVGTDPVTVPDASAEKNTDQETDDAIETYTYYLEISYEKTRLLDQSEQTFHPENKFLVIRGDRISLTPAYNTYELSDNSQEASDSKENIEEQ